MGDLLCIIIIIGIIWLVVQSVKEEYEGNILSENVEFNAKKGDFGYKLAEFFSNPYTSYQPISSEFPQLVNDMRKINERLLKKKEKDSTDIQRRAAAIDRCAKLAMDFSALEKQAKQLPFTRMMDDVNYGKIQKEYWDSVRSLSKSSVDNIIEACRKNMKMGDYSGRKYMSSDKKHYIGWGELESKDYSPIFENDIEMILRCVWFYATQKPYSAQSFQDAVTVFNCLVEKPHIDVTIAELYAMKQVGGEEVLREHVRELLKNCDVAQLTLIASALMWMNAYQTENMVLQHMLSSGMQMTSKMQERLHSLVNGGGNAPSGFDVSSRDNSMYFDVSALTWKDEEYTGLFENLAFQEKTLSYSLALRDEDKELFITQGLNVPNSNTILKKLNAVFANEYGNIVKSNLKNCVALSGNGEEQMEGILVESNECKQMGILVHVARIGKKVNIKFYTLFMPSNNRLADQKQQVLSLYKKLSPSVNMWESSLKDTILMAIQQLLNSDTQSNPSAQNTFKSENTRTNDDAPIF